jgi:hypothetical protein
LRALASPAALLGALLLSAGCKDKETAPAPAPATSATQSASAARSSAPVAPSVASAPPKKPKDEVVGERPAKDGKLAGIDFGDVSEIGPAGAASASAEGVVLVTSKGEVVVVPEARFASPPVLAAADFAPTARGPAIADGAAYFVLQGKLVRRTLPDGKLEVLADDAQSGTRASALPKSVKQPTAVAYITRADAEGTSQSKLLVAGKAVTLTADGAGSSSVALARGDEGVLALYIDGRSAMTPVHLRGVDLEASPPALGADQVVWVGGSAQPLTEILAAADGEQVFGFLPIAKDISHFGVAVLGMPKGHAHDAQASWRLYDNGLDMAPVSAARVCGSLLLAYARPRDARPHAPQELVVSQVGGTETAVVVTAQGFASASLFGTGKGGLLVYTADRRTFAVPLGCRTPGR